MPSRDLISAARALPGASTAPWAFLAGLPGTWALDRATTVLVAGADEAGTDEADAETDTDEADADGADEDEADVDEADADEAGAAAGGGAPGATAVETADEAAGRPALSAVAARPGGDREASSSSPDHTTADVAAPVLGAPTGPLAGCVVAGKSLPSHTAGPALA